MRTPCLTVKSAGFTLLETLVAVAILAMAVAGPLYVAERALIAAQVAKDQMVASYLAQEGIEYARSMRDREFLYAYSVDPSTASDAAWQAFAYGQGGSGQGSIAVCESQVCTLDPSFPMGFGSGKAVNTCPGTCSPLYLSSQGQYEQTGQPSAITPFTRTIQATPLSANDLQVVSKVTWQNHGVTYTVSVTDNLTPWQ